jgi:hypothetical protein
VHALLVWLKRSQAVPAALDSIPSALDCFGDVLVLLLLLFDCSACLLACFIPLDALCGMVLWTVKGPGYG